MIKTNYEVTFMEDVIDITQEGFFYHNRKCNIKIPYEHQERFGTHLKMVWEERMKKVNSGKYRDFPQIEIDIRLSKDRVISIAEGCANMGNPDDAFAIYDIEGEPMFNDFLHKTIVIQFDELPHLINFVQKYNLK